MSSSCAIQICLPGRALRLGSKGQNHWVPNKGEKMFRNIKWVGTFVALLTLGLTSVAMAAPSGAIFTTLSDGSEVNFTQYPSKEAVYLDGGPGPGAPQTAAGLDNGRYVFQVTDPSGKTLLSTDTALHRQFD